VCSALDGLASAAHDRNAFINAYRAMRASTRAVEALYPLAPSLPQVSRFFVDPPLRDDPQLAARLSEAAANPAQGAGVSHIDNARDARGGYSLYVPEYHDAGRRWPLIVALHGGSGHGADFLWTWLRDARSRGAIVLSPTSRDRTWSLMGPDIDSPRLEALVRQLSERWNVDERRVLLTGMSDGGTFAYISGLRPGSPITHLAPSSASFHPMLLDGPARARLVGLPVYLMHGVRDWMFPVDIARLAAAALSRAGSQVVYRELDDLSHTYPRDENPRFLDWFLG
jgi:phospholipase/carboxylesterase